MSTDIIIQLIISFAGIIAAILAVLVILAKKLPSAPSNGNGSVQRQFASANDYSNNIATKFDDQVNICNQRWLEAAKLDGRIDAYMIEIRDRLTKIEGGENVRVK